MLAKKVTAAVILTAGAALLGGCEMLNLNKAWEPRESVAVSVSEEGMITEYVRDVLDEAYYSAEELEQMITDEVNAYNGKTGAESIVIKKFETEGQSVSLTMEYAGAKDYAAFNNTEFFSGSVINAQLAGYLFDRPFKRVQGGVVQGGAVSGSEALKHMAAEVLVVTAPLEVRVPGNVIFTTTNAEVFAADDVNASGRSGEEDPGLVLPSNAVYKKEKSFAEKAEENRVYILYEIE